MQQEETARAIVHESAAEEAIIYSMEHGQRQRGETRIKGINKYRKRKGPKKKRSCLLDMAVG